MKIVHLSDLHFGTDHNDLTAATRNDIKKYHPDLAIVSGDFTQVASKAEFKKSQQFLKSLSCPYFCVPGNHDVPRFHILERFFNPFAKYKRYIDRNLYPVFENEDIVLAGINSARAALPHWNWANGAISDEQRDFIEQTFAKAGDKYKILTLHHPLHKAEGVPLDVVVFGGGKAVQKIHDLGIDLVLTGHVHHASVTAIKKTVFVSAATALSSRIRYQENGFNLIETMPDSFKITHKTYKAPLFVTETVSNHTRHTMTGSGLAQAQDINHETAIASK